MQRIGFDPWWSHTVLQLLEHLPPASEALVQVLPRVPALIPNCHLKHGVAREPGVAHARCGQVRGALSLNLKLSMNWHATQVWRTPGVGKSVAPMQLHRTYGGCHGDIAALDWSADSQWVAVASKDLTARCALSRARAWRYIKEEGYGGVSVGHRVHLCGTAHRRMLRGPSNSIGRRAAWACAGCSRWTPSRATARPRWPATATRSSACAELPGHVQGILAGPY